MRLTIYRASTSCPRDPATEFWPSDGPMGVLLIPAVIALLVWANIVIVRLFLQRHAAPVWWMTLSVAWLAGAGLGVWGGFFFEYQPSPRLRVFGAPVPAAF